MTPMLQRRSHPEADHWIKATYELCGLAGITTDRFPMVQVTQSKKLSGGHTPYKGGKITLEIPSDEPLDSPDAEALIAHEVAHRKLGHKLESPVWLRVLFTAGAITAVVSSVLGFFTGSVSASVGLGAGLALLIVWMAAQRAVLPKRAWPMEYAADEHAAELVGTYKVVHLLAARFRHRGSTATHPSRNRRIARLAEREIADNLLSCRAARGEAEVSRTAAAARRGPWS